MNAPPQLRAGLATLLAFAGLQASGSTLIDVLIAAAWAIGGLADFIVTRRKATLEERKERLQDALRQEVER